MQLIRCIIRPEKLDDVKAALSGLGVSGMTVFSAHGHGHQRGDKIHFRGAEYTADVFPRIEIGTIVADEMVDDVVGTIIKTARTGRTGDGRVFVTPVSECYKIRTGEREL
jgi:nitrogen regulatory protein P-II 1